MSKQRVVQKVLRFLASKILKKYKPRVIGVTGSVGKSITKEMIFSVLKNYFRVRRSKKNYNNEVGIPLAIIGVSGEKKNLWQWFGTVCKAIILIIFPGKYPEILILELATDRPGDIKYFCDFIVIEVGILTNVGISHLENFGTKEAIFEEKSYLLKRAEKLVIYNGDNIEKKKITDKIIGDIRSYGFKKEADFMATEIGYKYNQKNILAGMIFKIGHKDKLIPGKLNNLIGYPYLYGALVALSIAEYFNIDLLDAVQFLENTAVIPGHMSLIKGIKGTSIIDDTYNSAPISVEAALSVIREVKISRRIIVLGDMLELGTEEKLAHQIIGRKVAEIEGAIFVAVGDRMKLAVDEFKKSLGIEANFIDIPGKVYWFRESIEAGGFIQDLIKQEDVILVKGSQGMRMEKIVLEIMAEPNKRQESLVRQDKNWL